MIQRNNSHYLIIAKQWKIIPNFYLSEPYLELTEAKCYEQNNWIWIEEEGMYLFPPLPLSDAPIGEFPIMKIWSDFEMLGEFIVSNKFQSEFLDFEYVFNPSDFNNMEGKKWNVYRKNIRKWPRNHEKWSYNDVCLNEKEAHLLIGDWLIRKQQTVQDGELLARFAFFEPNENIHRKFLYSGDQLVAINAWDENWFHINFRVCMVQRDQPFLDEFTRYLFYIDSAIQSKKKLINDGGTLGNEGLERFKDKMNPIKKRKVYSWIIH